MKKNKVLFIILCMVGLIVLLTNFKSTEKTLQVSKVLSSGKTVDVVLTLTDKEQFISFTKGHLSWGTGKMAISSMKISINKKSAGIPFSAYIGISDPNEIQVEEIKDTIKVHIKGGDAGASYRAHYSFFAFYPSEYWISSRLIEDGEFSNEAFERTNYSYIPNDGR